MASHSHQDGVFVRTTTLNSLRRRAQLNVELVEWITLAIEAIDLGHPVAARDILFGAYSVWKEETEAEIDPWALIRKTLDQIDVGLSD